MKKDVNIWIMLSVKDQQKITVGIMDQQPEIFGYLSGIFLGNSFGHVSGRFSAKWDAEMIIFFNDAHREMTRSPLIRLVGQKGSTFSLVNVTIGNRFHWERSEDQTFQGNLILLPQKHGTIVAINEIPLEDYLISVISSEMSATAPIEFLKAHAILSRSWLLAALDRKKKKKGTTKPSENLTKKEDEVIRWYDREDHDLFDVCADDHCQRYQGITRIESTQAQKAVQETHGRVMIYQDEICDARYSKACGGITEDFDTAWENERIPYLESVSDSLVPHRPIKTEEEASAWILSAPQAYCHTTDEDLLKIILPDFDLETKSFFRWTIEYSREELEEILHKKSGFDFGILKEIIPLRRGSSGRISRLKIIGSKISMIVGKELEIRRWLSYSHLYSSAFLVAVNYNLHGETDRFTLHGAGWGHGVGLCQIGAAVMATQGSSAEQILSHYFTGVEIKKIY